jgi:hypothetical protein
MHVAFRRDGLRGALCCAAFVAVAGSAGAAPTKDECLEAHSRGQDQREAGHLALARDSFAVCSQPACPALVQSDCAEFTEQLSRLSPTVSFAARDQAATDLPDTEVYVDGALVARRLDEGRSYDMDPGKHSIRFVHGERSVLLNVVINQGEHGRNLIASFVDATDQLPASPFAVPPARRDDGSTRPEAKRPVLPLIVAIGGGAALATGAVLMGVGFGKIPGNCSLGSHECTSPPGDAAFGDAHGGVTLVNAGLGTAIAGAVLGISGLVWYFTQSPVAEARPRTGLGFNGSGFVF